MAVTFSRVYKLKKSYIGTLLLLGGIQLLVSLFLISSIPSSDSYFPYLESKNFVETGTSYLYKTWLDDKTKKYGDPRIIKGKDGLYHSSYEPIFKYMYLVMLELGSFIDKLFFSNSSWTSQLLFIQIPHLLILPLTSIFIFLTMLKLGISPKIAAWTSTLGIYSTMIPYYSAAFTRDGLGIPITIAAFYFAFSVRSERKLSKQRFYYLIAGVVCGVAIFTKITTASIVAPIAFYFLMNECLCKESSLKNKIVSFSIFILPLFLGFSVLLLDKWFTLGYITLSPVNIEWTVKTGNAMKWSPMFLIDSLFALTVGFGKGFFWYNPLFFFVILAGRLFKKYYRLEYYSFIIHIFCFIVLAMTNNWSGDDSWGPRYLVVLIPLGLVIIGFWLDKQISKKILYKVNLVSVIGVFIQIPALVLSLGTYSVAMMIDGQKIWDYGWYFAHMHFIPSLSPIFVFWKALISKISSGLFFGNSFLWVPTLNYPISPKVNFAQNLQWREVFWIEIIHLDWDILPIFLLLVLFSLMILFYQFMKSLHNRRKLTTIPYSGKFFPLLFSKKIKY